MDQKVTGIDADFFDPAGDGFLAGGGRQGQDQGAKQAGQERVEGFHASTSGLRVIRLTLIVTPASRRHRQDALGVSE
jgi:hypothetical protein